MKQAAILLAVLAALALGGIAWSTRGGEAAGAYPAPGLSAPADARAVSANGYKVVPQLLAEVYAAFGQTEEAAIYDGLAGVAAGPALEALYLERVGAMAEAGLEPDQEIHELELISLSSRAAEGAVTIDARWRVLGTVGHAEHLHVRGNAYSARLRLEPAAEAWRLTGFTLLDVDRSEAGTTTARVEGPWTGAESPGAEPGQPAVAGN